MTIGQRIAELRKNCGYSQEYIAERLDVSRQAVSKWESDKSSPSTDNLIALSELLGSTVEYIAVGKENTAEPAVQYITADKPSRKKMNRKQRLIGTLGIAAAVLISLWAGLHIFAPIEWDSGACGGGYGSDIYRTYETELLESFVSSSDNAGNITAITVVDLPEVDWEGRNITIRIPVRYTHKTRGEFCEWVSFFGKKYWTDCINWKWTAIDGSRTPDIGVPMTHWGEDGKPVDDYYELLEEWLIEQSMNSVIKNSERN